MKRPVTKFLILSVLLLTAGLTWAAAPPVVVTHKVTGYRIVDKTAAIDISVHVKNPGDTALSNLTLFFISMPPVFKGQSILKVGSLAPHQSKDLSVHLEAPAFIGKKEVESRPLFFSGKYNDTYGTPGEFPVTSHPGGIK